MPAIYYSGNLTDAITAFNDKPKWLIEPYIPAAGIVLLYGKFSVGKSPLIWKIAQSVSDGTDFFGYPVQFTGPVLYIEVDEPLRLTVERLKHLDPMPKQVHVLGVNPFSIVNLSPEDAGNLNLLNSSIRPALVAVNTLRKSHHLDDKGSEVASRVYGAYRNIFPDSTLLVVHHDRKTRTDKEGKPIEDSEESFSGTQAWINDAQIGIHLTGNRATGQVRLEMTKSQLSMLAEPLQLKLGADGVNWEEVGATGIQRAFFNLDPEIPKMHRYAMVAESLNISDKTVQRAVRQRMKNLSNSVTH